MRISVFINSVMNSDFDICNPLAPWRGGVIISNYSQVKNMLTFLIRLQPPCPSEGGGEFIYMYYIVIIHHVFYQ